MMTLSRYCRIHTIHRHGMPVCAAPCRGRSSLASWLLAGVVSLTAGFTQADAAPANVVPADGAVVGHPLPPWQAGYLDIHQFNTGRGDAALFTLPDGTTMLLDAGVSVRDRPEGYDAPPRGDSMRPGEWFAHYVRAVHPAGEEGSLRFSRRRSRSAASGC